MESVEAGLLGSSQIAPQFDQTSPVEAELVEGPGLDTTHGAEDEGLESAADLQRIHGAGSHLLGLIAGILDLSKVEAGIMQVELTEVAVAEVLEHVRVTAEPLARGNEFILDLQEDLGHITTCLLYTSPSPRDKRQSRMPSSA